MKLKQLALAVGALTLAGAASAEFSANIGATSNYLFRGVTQTDDGAAISGGLDYAHDSGFYAGTWASNVEFGGTGGAEVDLYGGFSNAFDNGLGYDVGVVYYAYPNDNKAAYKDINFAEIYGSLSYEWFEAGLAYTIDSDASKAPGVAFVDGDLYYYAAVSFEVAPTWTVGGTIGYYDFKEDGSGANELSYAHAQLDIGKSAGDFGDFTFTLSKADDVASGLTSDDLLVVVSWGKTFD